MRNVFEVLQEKEHAVQRVAHEIEMLRLVAPLLTGDAPREGPTHDVHAHDVQAHNADSHDASTHHVSTEDANTYDTLMNVVQIENAPTRDFPSDIRHDHANTGIVSAPSLLANDPANEDSDDQDEADSVPGTKISGRLKKLVKPLVSFVAG